MKMNNTRKLEIKTHIIEGDSRYKLITPTNAKSNVWNHFQLIVFNGKLEEYACCIKCRDVLAYSSKRGTGSLIRHNCPQQNGHKKRIDRFNKRKTTIKKAPKTDPLEGTHVTSDSEELFALLMKWNLLDLYETLKSQHVTTTFMLKQLTDAELNELISNAEHRAVLRARINEWLANDCTDNLAASVESDAKKRSYIDAFDDCSMSPTDIDVKGYFDADEPEVIYTDYNVKADNQQQTQPQLNLQHQQQQQLSPPEYSNNTSQHSFRCNSVNVFELLTQSIDGQTALTQYNLKNRLDLKERQTVLNILASALNAAEWQRYNAMLQRLTTQLFQLFPEAKYSTLELYKYFTSSECGDAQKNDIQLFNLLRSWDLPHLYEYFKDQNITIDILRFMEPNHIDKLFKNLSVGDEVRFMYKFKRWLGSSTATTTVPPTKTTTTAAATATTTSTVSASTLQQQLSLATILSDSSNGEKLRKFYEQNEHFTETHRVLLINTICKYIELHGIHLTLSASAQLEQEICEMFPTEKLEYYATGKRGRIYSRVWNTKRFARKETPATAGVTATTDGKTAAISVEDFSIDEDVQTIDILRTQVLNEEEFEMHWSACYRSRFLDLDECGSDRTEILQRWPEYKGMNAAQLFSIDFDLMYPNAMQLIDLWPSKMYTLANSLDKKISNNFRDLLTNFEEHSEDSRDLILLWLSHHFLPPVTRVGSRGYTVCESQNAFVIIGATIADINGKLAAIETQNGFVHPCLLVIGSLEHVESVYVYLEQERIPMESVLKAADICLKIYMLFKIDYPDEALQFYNFMRLFFYNVEPTQRNTKLTTLINELNCS